MPTTKTMSRSLIPLVLLLSSGCAMTRSEYEAPNLPVESSFSVAPSGAAITQSGPWWNEFGDPDLAVLVERVLDENADLASAGLRLKQARMSAALARQGLLPSGSAGLSSGASTDLGSGSGGWNESSSASLNASWEIDLFGRIDAEIDAASWEAEASAQDLAATRLALIGTTVDAWYQLGLANERIALGQSTLAYLERLLELVQVQYDAGSVSRLDLRDAQQSVAAQRASLTQLEQTRFEVVKTIAALLGQQDYDGAQLRTMQMDPLPAIEPGVPATLLARRPDLAAAELRLRSTLAGSDATVASYLPSFSLTGALGTASSTLLGFFSDPVASLGAALNLSQLNPEKIRLGTGIARLDFDIAYEQFRQTFYDALRDTEIALSARSQYIAQGEDLQDSFNASNDALDLYERQYRAGQIPLRDLLEAQERLRSARSNLIQNRYNQLSSQIAVYQALGGEAGVEPAG